jgi:hypothetical protein
MSKYANPLNNIKIASPCSADWNEMIGDARKRYCGDCKLNVYNLSEMTKTQAENLIIESEGSLCVRFYRRADGTVLTKDCPVGWQKIKNRTKVFATAAASVVFSFFGATGLNSLFSKTTNSNTLNSESHTTGVKAVNPISKDSKIEVDRGQFATMGNFSVPTDRRLTLSNGGMSNAAQIGSAIKNQRKR